MRSGGRRSIVALAVLGAVGVGGCGEQVPGDDVAVRIDSLNGSHDGPADWYADAELEVEVLNDDAPTPSTLPEEPVTPEIPEVAEVPEQPELDRSDLDRNLAALSASDAALAEHHLDNPLGEGTWVVAAPMTVEEAVRLLFGSDPETIDDLSEDELLSGTISAYTVVQVGDGIVAYEDTGFADPPKRLLAALSQGGGASAVVTDNIEAITRFGYARDGRIVFDDPEYAFVDDLSVVPAEVRDLARLAWEDLDGPTVATADWASVGMAMAEKVTGVRASRSARDGADWYVVPMPWGVMEDY